MAPSLSSGSRLSSHLFSYGFFTRMGGTRPDASCKHLLLLLCARWFGAVLLFCPCLLSNTRQRMDMDSISIHKDTFAHTRIIFSYKLRILSMLQMRQIILSIDQRNECFISYFCTPYRHNVSYDMHAGDDAQDGQRTTVS